MSHLDDSNLTEPPKVYTHLDKVCVHMILGECNTFLVSGSDPKIWENTSVVYFVKVYGQNVAPTGQNGQTNEGKIAPVAQLGWPAPTCQ